MKEQLKELQDQIDKYTLLTRAYEMARDKILWELNNREK